MQIQRMQRNVGRTVDALDTLRCRSNGRPRMQNGRPRMQIQQREKPGTATNSCNPAAAGAFLAVLRDVG